MTKEDFDYGAIRYTRLDSPNFYTVRSETRERLPQQSDNEAIRMAYHGDDYELLSVSSRRFWHMDTRITDLNLIPTLFNRIQTVTETAWTQEFRLSPRKHDHWDWQAGLFYSNIDKHSVTDTIFLKTDTHIDLKKNRTDNYALFGQLAYQDFKWIKLHLDMRLDYVNAAVDGANTYPNGKQVWHLNQRVLLLPISTTNYRIIGKSGYGITNWALKAGGGIIALSSIWQDFIML